jgi:hypothetical protein
MHTNLWSLTLIFFLSACTTKDETKLREHFEQRKHYHKQLMKTEKVQLYEGNLTKVLLTATYLNESGTPKDKQEERFIIGLYVDDEQLPRMYDFNLTLEGHQPTEVTLLKPSDVRLKNISFVSDWNQFYLMTFPHIKQDRFSLVFESAQYGKGRLEFAKKAKYTFTKKAF